MMHTYCSQCSECLDDCPHTTSPSALEIVTAQLKATRADYHELVLENVKLAERVEFWRSEARRRSTTEQPEAECLKCGRLYSGRHCRRCGWRPTERNWTGENCPCGHFQLSHPMIMEGRGAGTTPCLRCALLGRSCRAFTQEKP